ncbi:MAG: glycosyltransferase [Acidobacteriota bacterium]
MMPGPPPRVALFTDSYNEANGVARLSRALTSHAVRTGLPFLCVHGASVDEWHRENSVQRLSLRRSQAAFRLEHDLRFDPLLWRHYGTTRDALTRFRPDVVHITGPSDVGQLGALLAHRMGIPIVGSWHTNIHQYAALRASRWCRCLPPRLRARLLGSIERHSLSAALLFYRVPRVLMAPNQDLVSLLSRRTGKVTHLMKHGVDSSVFAPRSHRGGHTVRVGFVGRLSAEKQVRRLANLSSALDAAGIDAEFVIVGDGSERKWLEMAMPRAHFSGILDGEQLADAYASFDLFAFPSQTETFGLAVLEAMASGVTVLAMAQGGPGFVIEHDRSGWLARTAQEFVDAGVMLAREPRRRERLGRGARARAERWSWDIVADELYDVYREIFTSPSIEQCGFQTG